ncbi:ATP-binding protein [Sphingomonas nostoxanthinifaciens]|uniref:ATP-binding protein n=1 Tax=Sphingomonas nostoxanthinifaciens TaxID=2872652 RepID=UPI001CC1D741|nr:ATP-binding protein [Sphingomonas nostoxanthinifaciens]UAK24470.1 tetratricopeptide repeat protein [Sphingomonas nostoxanthinifaciens]
MKRGILAVIGVTLASAAAAQSLPPVSPAFDARVAGLRADIMRNPQQSLDSAAQLRIVADRMTQPRQRLLAEAIADWLGAEALLGLNRPREARRKIEQGLRLTRQVEPDSALAGELILARGGASNMMGRVQDALTDYQRAYQIFQRAGEARGQSVALQTIGSIYRSAGDYENALRYNAEAIEAYGGDPALLLSAYNNRGNALIELGRSRAAIAEYNNAFAAALKLGSPLLQTRILQNLARAQTDAGDYTDADATLARAFRLSETGPAASWQPALYGVAAQLALRRGQLDRAADLIDRTFAGASAVAAAMPMRDFHRTAYEIYKRLGQDDKALAHLEAFKQLDDDARAVAASASAALMTAQFDFANQDAKIKTLQLARERVQTRLRTTIIGGLLAAATIISALLALGFISIRRSRNQVRATNAELTHSNAELGKALAAKGEFLATTSHEIRTPLNGILGMTQVILADQSVAGPLRNRIELVHGAGETMRALVDDILDMAKIENGELRILPVEMNLARLLDDAVTVWSGQAETKRLTIETDLGQCPAMIIADEVRLRQIVFNLMSNAIKFTDQGHVRLSAGAISAPDGERLVIRIADTGIGIPADRLADIFDSFSQVDSGTTRRHSGTGLGLAICRNIARAMGGDVTVSSLLGAGSTFILDLPLERAAVPEAKPSAGAPSKLAAADLLLVDANPLAQGIMRALLTPAVGSLRIVASLDEALAAIAAGGVDHVVADGGTLGLDAGRAGAVADAAHAAGARLTLLWPQPDASTADDLRARGVTHLIAKPIQAPDLLAALQMVYDPQPASRDIAA